MTKLSYRVAAGWAVLSLLGVAQAEEVTPVRAAGAYMDVSVEAWSNGVPILNIDGDWSSAYRQRSGTQRAYVMGRAEAGASFDPTSVPGRQPWRIGLLARADASARLSGEAAQILYHYQSRTDPDQPGSYNADTNLLYWRGKGVSLHAPTVTWGSFKLDTGWDHMRLQRMRSLQSRGLVTYNADDSYSYLGTLRDDDSTKTTPFLSPADSSGVGDALSVALTWQASDARASTWLPTRVQLRVDDAWSRLSWSGVNGDDAVLNSAVSQRDENGYIQYRAAIVGQYTRRTLVERIPVSTQVQLAWQREAGAWTMQSKNRLGLWQHWLGWQSAGDFRWRAAAEPFAGALSVGVDWRGLSASIMADRLDNEAHVMGAQLSWAVPFAF
ncbi:hypothetical protein [Aquabacterium sp.]|uniref:hypothetical protein n=1 Tax=Aquabacterium sp. TaxID=1872578 RepID=UPI0035B20521